MEEILETLLVAIAGGFVGALTNHFFQSNSRVIRKITKEKTKEKLELESVIDVINETKEITTAMSAITHEVKSLREEIDLQKLEYPQDSQDMNSPGTMSKFFKLKKSTEELNRKVENFIFILERDMMINKENPKVKNEIKEMKKINGIHEKMWENFKFEVIYGDNIPAEENYEVEQFLDKFEKNKAIIKIKQSIKSILKIYTAKLK